MREADRWASCELVTGAFALLLAIPFTVRSEGVAPQDEARVRAERFAAAGAWDSAVAAYEEIIRADGSQRQTLAPLLVRMALKAGSADKALHWANEVARSHPRPKAYLAGVHAELGHLDDAVRLAGEAMASAQSARERIELHWQLADLQERRHERSAAEAELRQAVEESSGLPERAAAERRLAQFLSAAPGDVR